MNYRLLGRSGLKLSEIGLGTMVFGDTSSRGTPPKESEEIIQTYLEAGGNHLDTANVYAGGKSEEIVGKAIKGRRDQVILATKVNFSMGDGPNDEGLSRKHIQDAVDASLKRLDTDYIDIYYMHCWDGSTPIEESLRVFNDLVRAGKVRYIGVSNFMAWQVMKSLSISDSQGWSRFVVAQYQYSLVNRELDYEFLELFRSEGVGLVPWGPLGGGFLSGKYKAEEPPQDADGRLAIMPDHTEESWVRRNTERNWKILGVVGDLAAKYNATHAQIAVAWLLARDVVTSVIVGVRTLKQLEDNLGAADVQLSEEDIDRLEAESAFPEMYPYRFIKHYGRA